MREQGERRCRTTHRPFGLRRVIPCYCPYYPRTGKFSQGNEQIQLKITAAVDSRLNLDTCGEVKDLRGEPSILKLSFTKASYIPVIMNGRVWNVYGENGVVKEGTLLEYSVGKYEWLDELNERKM